MTFTKHDEEHDQGRISIEMELRSGVKPDSDLGIQIASDGRVWVCIDGQAALRFQPHVKTIGGE